MTTPGPGERCLYIYRLRPGMGAVYDERHRAVWPEMLAEIDAAGIYDYRIWRHEEIVVCALRTRDGFDATTARLAASEIQRRWTESLAGVFDEIADAGGGPLWLHQVFAHNIEGEE